MLRVKVKFFGRLLHSPRAAEDFRFLPAIEAETKELALAKLHDEYEVLRIDHIDVSEIPPPATAADYYKERDRLRKTIPKKFHDFLDWHMNEYCDHTNYDEQIAHLTDLVDNLGQCISAYATVLLTASARLTCHNKTMLAGKK